MLGWLLVGLPYCGVLLGNQQAVVVKQEWRCSSNLFYHGHLWYLWAPFYPEYQELIDDDAQFNTPIQHTQDGIHSRTYLPMQPSDS
jgi:hypothetical protein